MPSKTAWSRSWANPGPFSNHEKFVKGQKQIAAINGGYDELGERCGAKKGLLEIGELVKSAAWP